MSNRNFEVSPERENNGVNPEYLVAEIAPLSNPEDINNVLIASLNSVSLSPEYCPTSPDMTSENEEKEEVIVNNSGISSQKVWLPNKDNHYDWISTDVLSKSNVWRCDYFITQGKKPENVTDGETCREVCNFKNK